MKLGFIFYFFNIFFYLQSYQVNGNFLKFLNVTNEFKEIDPEQIHKQRQIRLDIEPGQM